MSTDPRDVVRRWLEAIEEGDVNAAQPLVDDDAILHAAHPPEIAGDIRGGFDAISAWFERRRALGGDAFAWQVRDLAAASDRVVATLELRAWIEGRPVSWRQVAVYRMEGDRIVEIWLHEVNPPPSAPQRGGSPT